MTVSRALAVALSLLLPGCMYTAAPYDVPYSNNGTTPLVNTIVTEINCELLEMVRDDRGKERTYLRRETLIRHDYHAAMYLTIDSTASGGIAPVFDFPHPWFSFAVAPNYKHSRENQIGYNLIFSFVDLYDRWHDDPDRFKCPAVPNTDLAGNLGLQDVVSSALNLEPLAYTDKPSATGGIFNGFVTFTATKSIDRIGPTWTITHFNGPGPLLSGSIVTTNKLAFGFSGGPNANKGRARDLANRVVATRRADAALAQAINSDVATQLTAIRNLLR
ncbi:hypothetical protein [Methylobacterium radiotolerans]